MKNSTQTIVSIADIARYQDQEIRIAGWMYNLRSKGKIHFLQLRDGTGRIQGVAVSGECDPRSFETIGGLKMEASVEVTGVVRKDERAPSGYELSITGLEVIHRASVPV